MVRHFNIFLCVLLSLPLLASAEPSISVSLKSNNIEYGRPAYLKLIADDVKADLSQFSFEKLTSSFYIESRDIEIENLKIENEKGVKEIRRQIVRIKMYPRQVGRLFIPSISLGKIKSDVIKLSVLDAHNNEKPIILESSISSTKVWQREQILISISLKTGDEFATLKLRDQPVAGIEITPLPVNREWDKNTKGGVSTITTGWSILPLRSGRDEIELPAIEYHLNGVVRRLFHLPKIKLNTRPLPTYLPPTIPVGKIRIKSSITVKNSEPAHLLYTDDLAYWKISIESDSLTPYWLPPILRQIHSDEGIQFYPATSTRRLQPDQTGAHGRVEHSIPFKVLKNGFADMPAINVQYFDTNTGRLEVLSHQVKRPFSLGIVSRLLLILVTILVVLLFLLQLFRRLRKQLQYKKQFNIALKKIEQASSIEETVAGIRMIGDASGWPMNLTLSDWLKRWKNKYNSAADIDVTIKSLSLIHYDRKNRIDSGKNWKNITTQLATLLATPK